jgi:ribosomal-protein-alanine N-acetyltransferase
MFPEHLKTERLSLSQFCREHVETDVLYELFVAGSDSIAETFEYVPQTPFWTIKDAHDMIERVESSWEDGEMVMYAVYPSNGELAGYAALSLEWKRRTGTIGIILATPYWGHEYAVECADALTELAFEILDLELVAIGYEAGNEKSERMIEKYIETYGGQYDGLIRNWTPVDDAVLDHHRYTVTQEQYHTAIQ